MESKVVTDKDIVRELLIEIEQTSGEENAKKAAAIRDILDSRYETKKLWRKTGRLVDLEKRPDLWSYVRLMEEILADIGMAWHDVIRGGQTTTQVRTARLLIVRILKNNGLNKETIKLLFGVKTSAPLKKYVESNIEIIAIGSTRAYDSESTTVSEHSSIDRHSASKEQRGCEVRREDTGGDGDSGAKARGRKDGRRRRRSSVEHIDR